MKRSPAQTILEFCFAATILMVLVFGMVQTVRWVMMDLSERRFDHDTALLASGDAKSQLNPSFHQIRNMDTVVFDAPGCAGKDCGADDGHGHRCLTGSCPQPGFVCRNGACECFPDCQGKSCGDADGCGGKCDAQTCGANRICQDGACRCVPDCAGKMCGESDGCGEVCENAPCANTHQQCVHGVCECHPNCPLHMCQPDDGCGGVCMGWCIYGACTNGRCNCTPKCEYCGADDGCGGVCGKGQAVSAYKCGDDPRITCVDGQCKCIPKCAGKNCGDDNGCGYPCWTGPCPNVSCNAQDDTNLDKTAPHSGYGGGSCNEYCGGSNCTHNCGENCGTNCEGNCAGNSCAAVCVMGICLRTGGPSDWEQCRVECGSGLREIYRSCTNPPPAEAKKYTKTFKFKSKYGVPEDVFYIMPRIGGGDGCANMEMKKSVICSHIEACTPDNCTGPNGYTCKDGGLCFPNAYWGEWIDNGGCVASGGQCGAGTRAQYRNCIFPNDDRRGTNCSLLDGGKSNRSVACVVDCPAGSSCQGGACVCNAYCGGGCPGGEGDGCGGTCPVVPCPEGTSCSGGSCVAPPPPKK
jgi:hypothetical protein